MDIQIEVTNVKLGMFVARLDRPWLGTPFRFQGFWVHDLDAIDNLRKHCASVWVRTDTKGRPTAHGPRPTAHGPRTTDHGPRTTDHEDTSVVDWKERVVKADREARIIDFLPTKPVEHQDAVAVEGEFAAAHLARRSLCDALDEIVDDIKRDRKIAIAGLKDAVTSITDSILRNPDACMWLRLVKDRDSYTYYHLLDTSALAIAFGPTSWLLARGAG